jgi:isochorismate hydrolase
LTSFFVAQSDANRSKKILYINDMRDYFVSGQSKGTHTKAGH